MTVITSSHRLARAPLQCFWMVMVAQQIRVYLRRASQPLTRLWMMTAARHSLSALSLSRRATWPALKNTLVLPKQYWSGSEISSGKASLHRAWAWSWSWGPWSRMRYLIKNSSYVHLDKEEEEKNIRLSLSEKSSCDEVLSFINKTYFTFLIDSSVKYIFEPNLGKYIIFMWQQITYFISHCWLC